MYGNYFDNPLFPSDNEDNNYEDSSTDNVIEDVSLPDVARGRLFCLSHGRLCYRQFSITGDREWVCPDERHVNKLKS
jgi:hypothetical protein